VGIEDAEVPWDDWPLIIRSRHSDSRDSVMGADGDKKHQTSSYSLQMRRDVWVGSQPKTHYFLRISTWFTPVPSLAFSSFHTTARRRLSSHLRYTHLFRPFCGVNMNPFLNLESLLRNITIPRLHIPALQMPRSLSYFSAPVILLFSLPLAIFAVVTTTFALCILFVRASVVYAELLAAFIQAYLIPSSLSLKQQEQMRNYSFPTSPSAFRGYSPPSRRPSRSSSVGSVPGVFLHGPGHPLHIKSRSTVTLFSNDLNGMSNRDYEGVGGWRVQGDDEEEALWMGINSRLDLPAIPLRGPRSSWAGRSSGTASPELVRTPAAARPPSRGRTRHGSGTASPEGYFSVPLTGLTSVDRASRLSFSRDERPKSLRHSTGGLGAMKVTQQGQP